MIKIRIYILFLTISIVSNGYSQFDIDFSKPKKVLKSADLHFEYKNYKAALPGYEFLLKDNQKNGNLNLKVGVCKLFLKAELDDAAKYLLKSNERGEKESNYYLGILFHEKGNFDEAIDYYLKYKNSLEIEEYEESDIDHLIENSFTAKELTLDPLNVNIENLGSKVNSKYADYVPAINSSEDLLLFTSRRYNGIDSTKDPFGLYFEDVYQTTKDEHGDWQEVVRLPSPINTNNHDACVGLSPDGEKLLLYKTDEENNSGDLYYAEKNNDTWTYPRPFNDHINSNYWEPSASISANKKALYFSSNRSGGYGGRDIYIARKLPNGKWSHAQNMGPVINTQFDEDAPFIHENDSVLYFSSKGHKNMGGFDIFKSHLSKKGTWSLPENLGYPINSVDDDIYFVMSKDGNRGYYSSDHKGGFGEKDIYVIHFHEADSPLTIVKGVVIDNRSNKPVEATITVKEKGETDLQGIYRSNLSSGKYIAIVGTETEYNVVIEAVGYETSTLEMKINRSNKFKVVNKDFKLAPRLD